MSVGSRWRMNWREQEWKQRDKLKDYCTDTRGDDGLGEDDSTGDRKKQMYSRRGY